MVGALATQESGFAQAGAIPPPSSILLSFQIGSLPTKKRRRKRREDKKGATKYSRKGKRPKCSLFPRRRERERGVTARRRRLLGGEIGISPPSLPPSPGRLLW